MVNLFLQRKWPQMGRAPADDRRFGLLTFTQLASTEELNLLIINELNGTYGEFFLDFAREPAGFLCKELRPPAPRSSFSPILPPSQANPIS